MRQSQSCCRYTTVVTPSHASNQPMRAGVRFDLRRRGGVAWKRFPRGAPRGSGGYAMNKGGLVAEVAKRTGVSKAEVARVVDASIDVIRETVVDGERVTLADFGTFERKHRNERIARNPRKPDVPIVVPARDLPSFTAGKEFRGQVLSSA